jgi:hypothetical protein
MFEENPGRWNLFEVFQIDRSLTDLRSIRRSVQDALDRWRQNGGKVELRNGEKCHAEEAKLNELSGRLFDPVRRLKNEQFAHQVHSFAGDEELHEAVTGMTGVAAQALMPSVAGSALVAAIGPLLPTISAPRQEDDLPWPDPPSPIAIDMEPLQDAVLRES